MTKVVNKGLILTDRQPFLVKGWNLEMDLHTETISSLPLWVQLPYLDIKYWGVKSLSKLCSVLGLPIKTDRCTKHKTWIRYARVLVDMPIDGPFPEHIDFINKHDMLVRQVVKYEWLRVKCKHRGMFGHEKSICKKKEGSRKEWRPVATHNSKVDKVRPMTAHNSKADKDPSNTAQAQTRSEEFTLFLGGQQPSTSRPLLQIRLANQIPPIPFKH